MLCAPATSASLALACFPAAEKSSRIADTVGAILYTPICGFHGAFAALLVAMKQLLPDNEVAVAGGALKARAKVRGPGRF